MGANGGICAYSTPSASDSVASASPRSGPRRSPSTPRTSRRSSGAATPEPPMTCTRPRRSLGRPRSSRSTGVTATEPVTGSVPTTARTPNTSRSISAVTTTAGASARRRAPRAPPPRCGPHSARRDRGRGRPRAPRGRRRPRSRVRSSTCRRWLRSRWLTGSSSRSTRGSVASAWASASRCRSPPDSASTGLSARCSGVGEAHRAAATARRSVGARAAEARQVRVAAHLDELGCGKRERRGDLLRNDADERGALARRERRRPDRPVDLDRAGRAPRRRR